MPELDCIDIEFVRVGERPLLVDLHYPTENTATPYPLIIYVYGGGWYWKNRKKHPVVRIIDDHLLTQGYAVATIDYRVSTEAIFPAQIADCKAAIRWLRANADRYQLDPARFGIYGFSSGAHLAALLGLTGDSSLFPQVGSHFDTSDAVQAVCTFAVTSDFFLPHGHAPESPLAEGEAHRMLFGGPLETRVALVRSANPLSYVSAAAPPFLLLHNLYDSLVFAQQSEVLYEALRHAGVEATLYITPEDDHGLSGASEAERQHIIQIATNFFERHLKS